MSDEANPKREDAGPATDLNPPFIDNWPIPWSPENPFRFMTYAEFMAHDWGPEE